MSLDPTFELTPRSPHYEKASNDRALLYVWGADLAWPTGDLTTSYLNDRVYFDGANAGDPAVDYTQWSEVYRVPRIEISADLSGRGTNKELVLLLGFEVQPPQTARLLVYTKAAMLHDAALAAGDDQILVHLESLELAFNLSFVTAWNPGTTRGASWFFKGITGFVV